MQTVNTHYRNHTLYTETISSFDIHTHECVTKTGIDRPLRPDNCYNIKSR